MYQAEEEGLELQNNLLENEKVIDQLETVLQEKNDAEREYLKEIQSKCNEIKANLEQSKQQAKTLKDQKDLIEKLQYDIKILQKSNEDLKYLTGTLRKDAVKVK